MHTLKNVCENIYGTTYAQPDKTKDNLNARHDLKVLGIREGLHPQARPGKKYYLPAATYTLNREEKKQFCRKLREIKLPAGYVSNISSCVKESQCKLIGLKTHDCHVLIQQHFSIAIRGLLPKNITEVLLELCSCFRELCAKVLYPDKLLELEARIKLTICHLEMIYPPGFFTIMVHLVIHLVEEAIHGGPNQFRWMFSVERFLGELKSYVRNRARPEGSIAEACLATECMTFCSRYIDGFDAKLNQPSRTSPTLQPQFSQSRSSLFLQKGLPLGKCGTYILSSLEKVQAHRYVLFNCPNVIPYLEQHVAEIKRKNRNRRLTVNEIERIQNKTFHDWFRDKILKMEREGNIGDMREDLVFLAKGPYEVARRYRAFKYNFFRFLGELKSYVRNRARPEGSIAEACLATECMTFCSRYIDGFDAKLNQPSRTSPTLQPQFSQSRSSLFLQKGLPLGKCGTYILSSLEKVQAHRYVLFNCPNVIPYLEQHVAEIKRKNRNRRLTVNEIERIQNKTFHDWFRDKILKMEREGNIGDMREDLVFLAKGPYEVARRYRAFNVNGYKFRPTRYDKSTQNSDVIMVAKTSSYTHAKDRNPILGDVTYYGRLNEIIELDYMGCFGVVLFKCDWVDVTLGRGIKKDEYGFTLVNFSNLIHTGEKLEHEPFIFASQAEQVFYVQDQTNSKWCTAIGVKPRDVYHTGNEEILEDVEYQVYHAASLVNVESSNQNWVRLDTEGTIVDDNVREVLHRTNSM